jgi:hypothetical protein
MIIAHLDNVPNNIQSLPGLFSSYLCVQQAPCNAF